jgi:hypothetical protein
MQLVSCPKPEKGHNLLSIQIDIAFTSREKESQPKNWSLTVKLFMLITVLRGLMQVSYWDHVKSLYLNFLLCEQGSSFSQGKPTTKRWRGGISKEKHLDYGVMIMYLMFLCCSNSMIAWKGRVTVLSFRYH